MNVPVVHVHVHIIDIPWASRVHGVYTQERIPKGAARGNT